MKKLYEFDPRDYEKLLGAGNLNAIDAAMPGAGQIPVNTQNRTILIGLGGAGVETIDRIKRSVQKKFQPGWERFVAFLGIDADWIELEDASCLDRSECILTTQAGINERAADYGRYPLAWRPFASQDKVKRAFPSLPGAGSGRHRLIGKMKLHDKCPGRMSVDEEIAYKISWLRGNTFAPLSPVGTGNYEVYVIGGIAGGTGGGGFLEMPALIRKGLQTNAVRIHAMLYLPDTMIGLDPANGGELEANGYASLKELNYYQGMSMREGYAEQFSCNDPAWPELKIHSDQDFFSMPYLVGTVSGPRNNSLQVAMETVAEFIMGILASSTAMGMPGSMVDSVLSTALAHSGYKNTVPGEPGMEIPGEAHEFPKRFGAVGVARAAAPRKAAKAYIVGKVCDAAGLLPVDAAARAALHAQGATLLPFRAEMPADEGSRAALEVLRPLLELLKKYRKRDFDFRAYMHVQQITWNDIYSGVYDDRGTEMKVSKYVEYATGAAAMDGLRDAVQRAFAEYRTNVKRFVSMEGPLAFYKLFVGGFVPENGNIGVGIKELILRARDHRDPLTNNPAPDEYVAARKTDLEMARKEVARRNGLFDAIGTKRQEAAANWENCYNQWVNARVNEKLRAMMLGDHGMIQELFLKPAEMLAEEVRTFGDILSHLVENYRFHGSVLTDFQAFQTYAEGETEVNMAAMHEGMFEWLRAEADRAAQCIDGRKVRNALVESFFEYPDAWLAVPERAVRVTASGVRLANADAPIPAREMFDLCMQEHVFAYTNMDVTVENLFNQAQQRGISYNDYAQQIIGKLEHKSVPLCNADFNGHSGYTCLLYPQSLQVNNPAIAHAIECAAAPGAVAFASNSTDCITMYQFEVPFEIYRLRDLARWERHYEAKMEADPYNGLHGNSPDTTAIYDKNDMPQFVEGMSWYDYPAITYRNDPKQPDPVTGRLSHEGRMRRELDKMIAEAKELGVLYSEHTEDGWTIQRVFCDKGRDWQFDPECCRPDPETGRLPLGKALAEAAAHQNGRSLEEISRTVELAYGGIFSRPAPTEELAWRNAARVLRAHVPMFVEVRETIKYFVAWAREIENCNERITAERLPAQMIWMLKGGALYREEFGDWMLVLPNGKEIGIDNLFRFGRNGLLGYYLYKRLEALHEDYNEVVVCAKNAFHQWIANNDIEQLQKGEELAEVFFTERDALADKGAMLDGDPDAPVAEALVEAMGGALDPAELKKIELFYYRIGLWEYL